MSLITTAEFRTFRDVGKRIDEDKASEAIRLVELGELADIFGEFIHDIKKNALDPSYADLMDGSEFTVDGDVFTHEGVKSMMADLVYSRYIEMLNVNVTPFGATVKNDENSTPASQSAIREMVNQGHKDADSKFRNIKKYLDENSATFPRWEDCKDKTLGQGSIKINVI